MSASLNRLRAAIAAERFGAWIGAFVFEAFALGTCLPFSDKFRAMIDMAPLDFGAWVLGGFGAGLALAAAYFARRALLLRDVDRTPMMIKLLHDKEDVVWAHAGMGVDYRMYGATTHRSRFLSVLCESRENSSIEIPEAKLDGILRGLEHHLPHARIGGFSREVLNQYLSDPKSLRLVPREEAREGAGYREPAKRAKKDLPRPLRAPYLLVAPVMLALVPVAPIAYELLG